MNPINQQFDSPFESCTCGGNGYRVLVTYADAKPDDVPTPCCSCTIARYEMLYGKATFTVTPIAKKQNAV